MEIVEQNLFRELDMLLSKKHTNNFIVDIGASYNSHFLKYPCRGLLFEANIAKIMSIPPTTIFYEKLNRKVTPDNVISYLKEFNTPKDFLALNLDIDSYDILVLIEILKEYSPKIIISEINEKIPANIDFTVLYDKSWYWKNDHFYGYSIKTLEPILRKFNYKIHKVSYNNIILLKTDAYVEQDIEKIYQEGYLNADGMEQFFTWNKDVEHWQNMNLEEIESELLKYFQKYDGHFLIGDKCRNHIESLI